MPRRSIECRAPATRQAVVAVEPATQHERFDATEHLESARRGCPFDGLGGVLHVDQADDRRRRRRDGRDRHDDLGAEDDRVDDIGSPASDQPAHAEDLADHAAAEVDVVDPGVDEALRGRSRRRLGQGDHHDLVATRGELLHLDERGQLGAPVHVEAGDHPEDPQLSNVLLEYQSVRSPTRMPFSSAIGGSKPACT